MTFFSVPRKAAADRPAPPDLLWPLEINAGISASFGEYRGDRFHGGLDLSTRGETGIPVFAAADGDIFRLKVEWRGYGNAVYLRHRGGWTTVYAHLDRLENIELGIEDRVAARRRATGERFPGDIYLNTPIPVSQGQIIGWSGQSGAGGPHLHFELRDPQNRPVDPLRRSPEWKKDTEAPVFQAITITTADPERFVDGHLRRRRIPLQYDNGEYSNAFVPMVDGPFVAAVETMDPVGKRYRLGVGRLRAGLNDETGFELDLDSFRFEDTRKAGLVFDLDSSGFSPTVYSYRLVRVEGNSLVRGGPQFKPGAAGLHTLWFEAIDSAGNRAAGHINLLAAEPPRLRDAALQSRSGRSWFSYELQPGARRGLESLYGEPLRLEIEYAVEPAWTFRSLPLQEPLPPAPVPLDLPRSGGDPEMALRYRLHCGEFRSHWWSLNGTTARRHISTAPFERFDWSLDLVGEAADLRFITEPPVHRPPAVVLNPSPGTDRPGYRVGWDAQGMVASLSLADIGPEPAGIELSDAGTGAVLESLPLRLFRPDGDRELRVAAFGAVLDFPAAARFGREPLAFHPDPIATSEGLVLLGGPVRIRPDGLVLRNSARLRLESSSSPERPERLGIYRWEPRKKRWYFQGPVDPESGRFNELEIRRGGTFALMEDTQSPRLGPSFPQSGNTVAADSPFWVTVEDVGKGMDWNGVEFLVDGEPALSVYDPDRDRAETVELQGLAPGPHHLRIQATDRAGNRGAAVSIEFVVGPGRTP
jgi:hypothetical protein